MSGVRPAVIDMVGGEWTRLAPASLPRPLVDLAGTTWLPPTNRRRQAEATVRVLCPTEAPAEHVEDEPAGVPETDAQRRARQAAQATAAWT